MFSWKAKENSKISSLYFSKALDTLPHKKQLVKLEIRKGRGVVRGREVEISLGRWQQQDHLSKSSKRLLVALPRGQPWDLLTASSLC